MLSSRLGFATTLASMECQIVNRTKYLVRLSLYFILFLSTVQNGERTVSLVGAFDVAVVKASDPGLIVRDKRNGDSGASLRIGNLHLTVFLAVITFGLVTMLA